MAQADDQKTVEEYKTLWGAKILWCPRGSTIPDNMLEDAVKQAHEALEEFPNAEREAPRIAEKIKKRFDESWGPYWHVTVGRNFGCHVVHETQRFVYFYI